MTSQDWVLIIAALSLGIVQIVTAWHTNAKIDYAEQSAIKSADRADQKLDKTQGQLQVIHELTNSNLTSVKEALIAANARIEKLETLLAGSNKASAPEAKPRTGS
jgi:hypothetical protein